MNQQITTEFLKSLNACQSGINLVATYPDKDPEAVIRRLVADDHWDYANWLLPRLMDYRGYVSYAVYAAELVLPIWEKKYPDDKRPHKAIEAAKRCIDDPSKKNKEAARAAAAVVADSRAAVAEAAAPGSAGAAWAENLAWTARLAAATARAWGLEAKIIEKGLEILKK